jgi:4-hydroxythreonine-4-phosphate dehydrogenase
MAGKLAFIALEAAIRDLKSGLIDVLVTAPINKKNIQSPEFTFPGHTQYLASQFSAKEALMLMVAGNLRVGVVTGHIPLRDVSSTLSKELIADHIRILNKSITRDFCIPKPRIAVLGLNPHAGDDGLIGSEDMEVIMPAIEQTRSENMLVYGPFPADGFFGSSQVLKFDGVLAMYHDQGLGPFKAIAAEKGVNFTAGLPVIRTSPAHGTAYDLAGNNEASPDSFREAIFLAAAIYRNRKIYDELTANPLPAQSYVTSQNERNGSRYLHQD